MDARFVPFARACPASIAEPVSLPPAEYMEKPGPRWTDDSSPASDDRLRAAPPAWRRATLAMFLGGFATFAMLYSTQPLLPLFAETFAIGAARASLSVSAGTAALAVALIPASVLADRYGRDRVMKMSLALAAAVASASALVDDFNHLLILRVLLGAALAGLPAAAMAYLGAEVDPPAQGKTMGIYIAGNALGGMSGRLLAALLADLGEMGGWRLALFVPGLLGVIAALVFWRYLPPSRHFHPRAAAPRRILADARAIFTDAGLPWLFATGALAMGCFIGVYNYLGFHLMQAPFNFSQRAIGAVFLLYLVGSWSSAFAGQLADRHGRRRVQWGMVLAMLAGLALTLVGQPAVLIAGVAIFTFGFFAAHTLSSSWVAHRGKEQRGLATAIYLSAYYLGASLIGSLSGFAWTHGGWLGIVAALALCLLVLFAIVLRLKKLPVEGDY
ncbi:MAG: MFS transporter [Azoarcus sp.]|nr:MFS transporter [Azoarcus sp.]